jgi:hypothetical protein
VREKPVVEIARDFQITRQRVYQLITYFKDRGDYPEIKRSGRKSQPIDERTEELILETYRANNVGPTHLEKKIEEIYGIHIPHKRIYQVLLFHGLVEINMRNGSSGNMFGMNGLIPCRCGRVTGKSLRLTTPGNGLLHLSMIHLG